MAKASVYDCEVHSFGTYPFLVVKDKDDGDEQRVKHVDDVHHLVELVLRIDNSTDLEKAVGYS